ncbi:hypothetical protein HZY83_05340 [Gemella sp. GH3]|uniref:DUF5713 family protein n=1 Tax=unclassified Gemella TaxID=2624949 RepID=UPI0015D028DD|nr:MULTISPECIES: DUF5713 family protein [unclassified Gemella]MBF0714096.1 hypothetical protein [Gemella sp. GH3.1]NYS51048.1 hypothetical protein [Gemella sp. GH3]
MKKFDDNYILVSDMVEDEYYPNFLVEKVQDIIKKVITVLESGETNIEVIQEYLDEMTIEINDIQEQFEENNSEIESIARDSIAVTIEYILEWFNINIDLETALQERDW